MELDDVAADREKDLHAPVLVRQGRVSVVRKQTLPHSVYRDTDDSILPRIVGAIPSKNFHADRALFEEVLTPVQGTVHQVLEECATALTAGELVAGSDPL